MNAPQYYVIRTPLVCFLIIKTVWYKKLGFMVISSKIFFWGGGYFCNDLEHSLRRVIFA